MLRRIAHWLDYWVAAVLIFPALAVIALSFVGLPAWLGYAILIPPWAWVGWWAVKEQRKDDAQRRLD